MAVPDKSQFARDFLGPRLMIVGGEEETRAHTFEAVNAGCVQLRTEDPRWGLLEKTGGAQVQNRAVDIWLYDLGNGTAQVVDVVGNSEGAGNPRTPPVPSWGLVDIRPISQWKVPFGDSPNPGPTPPPDGNLQAQIDALRAELDALKQNAVQFGQTVGLRAWGNPEQGQPGKILSAENGGPTEDHKPFDLTTRSAVGPWESWKVERGA